MRTKILLFDRYGKFIKRFNNIEEAREETKVSNVIRCLFRETNQTGGLIFAFENDERIDEDGNLHVVDFIIQYDDSGTMRTGIYATPEECPNLDRATPHYLISDKKFDNVPRKINCWHKNKKIGVFDSVGEARRITGSPCIWANLLGECKTTNELVFKFAD